LYFIKIVNNFVSNKNSQKLVETHFCSVIHVFSRPGDAVSFYKVFVGL